MAFTIALIHEENGAFGISFPDFPGCVSAGYSLEDAIAKGGQALALHVAGMAESGEAIPHLRSARELRFDPTLADSLNDATVAVVGIDLPQRASPPPCK
jgi:predicted RNase H-like HicB family nuclease